MSLNILKTMKWYKYDVRDLSDDEYTKWYLLMSEEKQHRVDGFRFVNDKKRTVAGEMLARKAIAEWCNVTPETLKFVISEYGKPKVIDLDIQFNISHSENIVVCAVDDRPVGIDIERIRDFDNSIVNRVCNKNEVNYILDSTISYSKMLERFFEIWTFKEAYFKCFENNKYFSPKTINYCDNNVNKYMFNFDEYIVHIVCDKKGL